jgi:bacterial/archaeal transporter family protein
MTWVPYACLSAVAALTAILAKIGIEGVPSNLGTAIRTIVITMFAWAIVGLTGEHRALVGISRRPLCFSCCLAWRRAFRGSPTSGRCNWARRRA